MSEWAGHDPVKRKQLEDRYTQLQRMQGPAPEATLEQYKEMEAAINERDGMAKAAAENGYRYVLDFPEGQERRYKLVVDELDGGGE